MDELELLKKDWNQQAEHQRLSVADIYPMLKRKSSSIVKTLFYISIGELVFWIIVNALPLFTSEGYRKKLDAIYTNDYVFTGLTVLNYVVILLFIYLLYKSYKSISVTDSAKQLMENILKTRKIIKYYVLYNLIMAGIGVVIGFYYALHNDPEISDKIAHLGDQKLIMVYVVMVLFTAIFIAIIWLFYKLIYGLLLKRLNRNYKELKRLET